MKIVYLGSRASSSGDSTYHLFEVYSDRPALAAPTIGVLSERTAPDEGEDVPF